jgi:hypothetical protein
MHRDEGRGSGFQFQAHREAAARQGQPLTEVWQWQHSSGEGQGRKLRCFICLSLPHFQFYIRLIIERYTVNPGQAEHVRQRKASTIYRQRQHSLGRGGFQFLNIFSKIDYSSPHFQIYNRIMRTFLSLKTEDSSHRSQAAAALLKRRPGAETQAHFRNYIGYVFRTFRTNTDNWKVYCQTSISGRKQFTRKAPAEGKIPQNVVTSACDTNAQKISGVLPLSRLRLSRLKKFDCKVNLVQVKHA